MGVWHGIVPGPPSQVVSCAQQVLRSMMAIAFALTNFPSAWPWLTWKHFLGRGLRSRSCSWPWLWSTSPSLLTLSSTSLWSSWASWSSLWAEVQVLEEILMGPEAEQVQRFKVRYFDLLSFEKAWDKIQRDILKVRSDRWSNNGDNDKIWFLFFVHKLWDLVGDQTIHWRDDNIWF